LTLAAGATAILGTFTLTVSAAGGGITKAQTITLKVTAATAIARYGRSRDRPQTAAVPWK
jgi:hypothetical protein